MTSAQKIDLLIEKYGLEEILRRIAKVRDAIGRKVVLNADAIEIICRQEEGGYMIPTPDGWIEAFGPDTSVEIEPQ